MNILSAFTARQDRHDACRQLLAAREDDYATAVVIQHEPQMRKSIPFYWRMIISLATIPVLVAAFSLRSPCSRQCTRERVELLEDPRGRGQRKFEGANE